MQIYLNKLLPIFILPVGITLLLLLFGLLSKRRLLISFASIVLWFSSMPLVSNFMVRSAEGWAERIAAIDAPQADAIVVLSSGRIVAPGSAGVSEWSDANRFFGGVELFKAGKAPFLIFTGGWAPWEPKAKLEGDILIKYTEALGVPLVNMRSTNSVVNTKGEAKAVAESFAKPSNKITSSVGETKILLVTSAFHMKRAQTLFELEGMQVIPFPVDFRVSASRELSILDFIPGAAALSMTEMALREYYGRLFYWLMASYDLTLLPTRSINVMHG
jgi:uncharacterized SAM-binding protein YcdF (DUF218 family)